ncbi:hypothetical protein [Amaricoccus sp.]|uniref:hypothetical protein n=1 Tax=Amaricoccus sp. TaxID=1872485 RepID=UPI001B5BD40B|nr:hypothetical protein [Amaricoccus sp.]MBP7001725.1 hypothetical protein [Amaricoccus sp.]
MSYNRNRIAGAIRARLAADLIGARDLTGSPFPVSAEGLPAYALQLQQISAQVAGIGSRDFIVEDRANVFAWAVGDQSIEAALWAFADELSEIVHRAPEDLGGLVERMVPAGAEVQAFPAAARVWGLQFSIDLLYIETPSPTIEAADFSAGFSLGFRA